MLLMLAVRITLATSNVSRICLTSTDRWVHATDNVDRPCPMSAAGYVKGMDDDKGPHPTLAYRCVKTINYSCSQRLMMAKNYVHAKGDA